MTQFVLMLTKDDCTVPDALEAFDRVQHLGLTHVGFKDIGLRADEMRALANRIRAHGAKVLLEVVSTSRSQELVAVQMGIELRVDYLLGGRHVEGVLPLIAGTAIRYLPFCGETVGHPTQLVGAIDATARDAQRLVALPGVYGVDLLAYRFAGDVPQLIEAVVGAVSKPVLVAGSIGSDSRVRVVVDRGAWGCTVGSALFEGKFAGHGLDGQIRHITSIDGVMP